MSDAQECLGLDGLNCGRRLLLSLTSSLTGPRPARRSTVHRWYGSGLSRALYRFAACLTVSPSEACLLAEDRDRVSAGELGYPVEIEGEVVAGGELADSVEVWAVLL